MTRRTSLMRPLAVIFLAGCMGDVPQDEESRSVGAGLSALSQEVPFLGVPIHFGDITGDSRDELCYFVDAGIHCHPAAGNGRFGAGWLFAGGQFAGLDWTEQSTLQLVDINGDRQRDACVRTQDGVVCGVSTGWLFEDVRVRLGAMSDANGWGRHEAYYGTIRFPDINGDGRADVCGRASNGLYCAVSNGVDFVGYARALVGFTNADGFLEQTKYATIQYADLDGDRRADVCARARDGIYCARSLGNGFETPRQWHSNFRDSYGWNAPEYALTIRLGDLNLDGRADLCGRGIAGIYCTVSNGTRFDSNLQLAAPNFRDEAGWTEPRYYRTITLVDVDGSGTADLCGRGETGIFCAHTRQVPYSAAVEYSPVIRVASFDSHPRSPLTAWRTAAPAQADSDPASEFCGLTLLGLECSQ